jgi:hypothetical protein
MRPLDAAEGVAVVPAHELGADELPHGLADEGLGAREHARERGHATQDVKDTRQNPPEWPCQQQTEQLPRDIGEAYEIGI